MFTYKGITSKSMGLEIANTVTYQTSARDIAWQEIPGRDGLLGIDNGRYKSVDARTAVILKPTDNIEAQITRISNWLLTDVGHHDLTFSDDPDFIYRAVIYEHMDISRLLRRLGRATIPFRLHPIKYHVTGLTEIRITNNQMINNPFNIDAKPIIRIVGSGDFNIGIGNSVLQLNNIGGGCIVDSENQTITDLDGKITMFDRMYSYPFPVLSSGNNQISGIPNNVEVFITPRIGAVI